MKKILRILAVVVLLVIVVAAGLLAWLSMRSPAMRPPSTESVEATPERLARGRYIVHHLSDCVSCHSDHNFDRFGMPIIPGTEGKGGMPFGKEPEFPGSVIAANITPDARTGLGNWTDGEIARAIREGVSRDGQALFPMMPYTAYRSMSDEDVKSVVAYIRTLKPIQNSVPRSRFNFPLKYIVKFMPKPLEGPVPHPSQADRLAYGKYLVTVAACADCHTPRDDKGAPVPGREFAGGFEMPGPWGRVVTANITPHPETFVGRSSREAFIARFKAFESLGGENAPPARPGQNTVMPWLAYAGLTEEDLGAMYDYLRTVPPVENRVVTFPEAVKAAALPSR
jgi:mono/diheme cytochrome c family protein